jgi:hypothetical protein
MNGHNSARTDADLESGALIYAEIQAITSGNRAVKDEVKIGPAGRRFSPQGAQTGFAVWGFAD